jgi:hypothetical protein
MTTGKAVAPKIRPISTTFTVTQFDEAGRAVEYHIQVDARRISCWTAESDGGSLTYPELFSLCCIAKARTETTR